MLKREEVKKSVQIEWHKELNLLRSLYELREKGFSYSEIANKLNEKFNIFVDGDTVKSAYHRHISKKDHLLQKTDPKEEKAMISIKGSILSSLFGVPKDFLIEDLQFDRNSQKLNLYLSKK